MNTRKFKVNQMTGILMEADRSLYNGKKDKISKSNINKEKTHLNYNVCPHPQYSQVEIKKIMEKVLGKHIRTDAVVGCTIITIPEDVPKGRELEFFKKTYIIMREIYHIKDSDIISAYVHNDETTPHMHFAFIPHVYGRDGIKETICWGKVMSRRMYNTQHKLLQEYLRKYGMECSILNGKTQGIGEVNRISKEKRAEYAFYKENNPKLKAEYEEISKQYGELEEQVKIMTNELRKARKEIEMVNVKKEELESLVNKIMELWNRFAEWLQKKLPIIKSMRGPRAAIMFKSAQEGLQRVGMAIEMQNVNIAEDELDRLDEEYNEFRREE